MLSKQVAACLTILVLTVIESAHGAPQAVPRAGGTESKKQQLEHKEQDAEDHRRAMESETKKVDLLYSTRPKRVVLGDRIYLVPRNYFGPKGKESADTLVVGEGGFGFLLFLPDFVGYTKDNWSNPFDRQLVRVLQVKIVDKNAMIKRRDGTSAPIRPSAYGDPAAQFEVLRFQYEQTPSFKLYGLEGYRGKGALRDVGWIGRRSNGEFYFLECSLAPDQLGKPGTYPPYPSCKTQYYSEAEDLRVAYVFAQEQFAKWREIDDAIWAKLRAWSSPTK